MTITVLLFASYADAFGRSRIDVMAPAGATVADVVARVRSDGGAERLPPRPLVAVNCEYAGYDRVLSADDEVALIPPVAGG
jgi:molybdopterin converting factor small subunit